MMTMSMRVKNGLAMLLALFVFAASSQAVACEMACASMERQSCCQGMVGADCTGAAARFVSEAGCTHDLVLAVERSAPVDVSRGGVHWFVVGVMPAWVAIRGGGRVVRQRPPLRRAWVDPLVVSLRV
jgi:hypothetical protein